MSTNSKLMFDIFARDNASPVFNKFGKEVQGTEKHVSGFDKVGKKAGKALAAGMLVAGAAMIKVTGDAAALDRKQREVVTLFGETGAAAKKSLGDVHKQVLDLSNSFGIAQETLTGGLYQAISAGVPRDNAFEFMKVASQAATAGVTDVETSVDGLTSIINAFGLEASDANAVADSMFTTVKDGKTNFEQLSASIFNIAPAAASAGVSFKEVNAAVATLTAAGTPTSVATTQIRAALVGLQRPSEAMDKIFGKLGYSSAEAALKQKGLKFAVDAVKDASGGSSGKLQSLLGSTEAVAAVNVLAGTGADKFADSLKNQADAAGATKDAYAVMAESSSVKFDKMTTRLKNVGTELGVKLLPTMIKVADGGVKALAWLDKNPAAMKAILIGVGALAVTFVALAVAAAPIPLAVGAIVAGLVFAYTKFEWFRKGVDFVFKAIIGYARFMWNGVFQPMFQLLAKSIAGLMMVWGKMLQVLGKVPGFGWAKKAGDSMLGAGKKAWGLADNIKKIPNKNVKVNADTEGARSKINSLQRLINGMNGKTVRVAVKGGLGGGITRNATGTNDFPGGMTWVGEKGPELLDLEAGATIVPAHKSDRYVERAMANQSAAGAGTGFDMGAVVEALQGALEGLGIAVTVGIDQRTAAKIVKTGTVGKARFA